MASRKSKVCRLVNGLYGLKQAGRGWYQEMSRALVKDLGFTRFAVDHSVFFRHSPDEHTIIAVAARHKVAHYVISPEMVIKCKSYHSERKSHINFYNGNLNQDVQSF